MLELYSIREREDKMEFEVSVKDYKNIDKYLNISCNTISIGDEGCIWKLPCIDELKELSQKVLDKGYKLKIITPRIPQEHFNKVVDRIKSLNEITRNYTLVINDLGLLDYCYDNNILPDKISMGRSISRSIEECPWYKEMVKNEKENLQLDLTSNSLVEEEKIELFSKYGVDEIESSLLPNAHYAYEWLNRKGWKINGYIGNLTMAYSRNCQYAKYKKLATGKCIEECNEKIKIKMISASDGYKKFDAVNKYSDEQFEFFILGSILYRENRIDLNKIDFQRVKYRAVPLDTIKEQPVMEVSIR